jgi:hypothetical protein
MTVLQWALIAAGVLHFGLLLAASSVPHVLDWRNELNKVNSLSRQLILVHGGFIVLTIVAFGLITLVASAELVGGTFIALLLCAFIGVFWFTRLMIQLFYFDARPWLTTWWRKYGYAALYGVFAYLATVYFAAAWANLRMLLAA